MIMLEDLAIDMQYVKVARRELREAERALERQVTWCRIDGHTWQEIADVLGITRQGAQQRYGGPNPTTNHS